MCSILSSSYHFADASTSYIFFGFSRRLSSPLSFVKLARPLLECTARCESSLIIICSPQQPDNCSQLHLSIVSSTGRSEEFPSPPGATPSCLCSSPSPASLLPPRPAMLARAPADRPSSSINLHMCVKEGWRVQTTITTTTLHQRVIWLSQAR